MHMIDVMKRLAELDAKNPNIVKESAQVAECGIMPEMGLGGMSQPHSPASINMTAASGPELSGMLRDIMQLAGVNNSEPAGGDMGGELGGEPQPQTLEPASGGNDATSTMRSVIDKLNIPGDDQEGGDEQGDDQEGGELGPFQGNTDDQQDDQEDDQEDDQQQDDDQEETDEGEYDNSPEPETTGYGSMTPSGDDLHREKKQNPGAAAKGDNPMTMEQRLMSDYKKFMNEN